MGQDYLDRQYSRFIEAFNTCCLDSGVARPGQENIGGGMEVYRPDRT